MLHLRPVERWLSASVLIGAPLVGLTGGLLSEDFGSGMSQELAYITENNIRWVMSSYLTLLFGVLMIPAIFVLMVLVRERSAALGYIGAAVAFLGIYFHGAVVGYALVEGPLVQSAISQEQVLAFVEGPMYTHVAFTMILMPFLGFFLGMILLAVALWRAHIAPLWVSALIIVAPLTEFVGPMVPGFNAVSPELMFLLLAVGLGYVGLKVLRGMDRDAARLAPVMPV